jgi:integrase
MDAVAQKKLLDELKGLLTFFGNHVFVEMKAEGIRLPNSPDKGIQTISEEEFQVLLAATERLDNWWWGEMMRGVLALHMATMVRPSELREAHLEDLDLKRRKFYIRSPKGGGSWSSPEEVLIFRPT